MANDFYRALALECDDLPDDSLLRILSGEFAGAAPPPNTPVRYLMAALASAPSLLGPEVYAATEEALESYRKGTLDEKADILENALKAQDFTINLTGTGATAATVWLLPPADWPLDTPFGRTKANAFGGPLVAVGGVVSVPLTNPGIGQVVRIVAQGSTAQNYGYSEVNLQPGGSVTIPLSFTRDTPACGGGLSVNITAAKTVDLYMNDLILGVPPENGWVGFFRAGTQTLLGNMKAKVVTGALTPSGTKVTFACADLGITQYDEWHWNDGWQGDFCNSIITVEDPQSFCLVPPTLNITSPGTGPVGGLSVLVQCSASASGGATIDRVEMYWQYCPGGACQTSNLIATVTAAPYEATWTFPSCGAAPEDRFRITAKAIDSNGLESGLAGCDVRLTGRGC
jgi:hypothetical protein